MSSEGQKPEKKPITIAETPAIEATRNQVIRSRESIKDIVEGPLVSACEEFYDKNIRTLGTTANAKDIEMGYGTIILDYDHLSADNKIIAQKFAEPEEYDEMQAVIIKIPITPSSTFEDIAREANHIAEAFKPQAATWIEEQTLTFEQMKAFYGITDQYPDLKPQDLIDPEDKNVWYYDTQTELFYPGEELFRKVAQER